LRLIISTGRKRLGTASPQPTRLALLGSVLLVGCTAITDFNQFSAGDLAVPPQSQPFGAMCDRNQTTPCVLPTGLMRPLMCFDALDGKPVMGNICTHDCLTGTGGCDEFGNAVCAQLPQVNYCLPKCSPSIPCRQGLTCCGDGVCKPGC
jgi:hypothetical protein